jgi:asparagine synthase (glutamine-hydrolysing)
MCGICGVWAKDGFTPVEAMVESMKHRGPDDHGLYHDDCVSLGMTRLAVIDLSPAGHQPMCNPEKNIWIVYNGEVYNFQEERRLLEAHGYKFVSQSDTEVILRLYQHYGDDFLLRLRGMFALAIYDRRHGPGRERLLLARDQVGIKPLLFARAGDRFVFASELKALIASGLVKPEINPISLRLLLTFGSVYQPRTMLRGVQMLLPAHRLIFENGRERIERYWSLDLDRYQGSRNQPYEELVRQVANALEESVRLQMVSDVPVGAFLSGGVDSSFIIGLMTRIAGSRVKTFSVGFEAEGAALDETDEAGRAARFFGADHTRVVVCGRDLRDRLPHIIRGLDQPSVDGVNSYFVSMVARQAVTVALSGTGGDELFAGYPWFAEMAQYERALQENPQSIAVRAFSRLAQQPVFDPYLFGDWGNTLIQARNESGFLARYANTYNIFGVMGTAQLVSPALHRRMQAGRAPVYDLKGNDELSAGSAVERVKALCLRGYTQNQLLRDIDAMSMAHSLEVRVPFLDVPLIDLSLSLPSSALLGDVHNIANPHAATYRESGSKKILVDAGRQMKILPENIDLQPKRGFTLPMNAWLKGAVRDVMEDTLSMRSTQARGLLQPEIVERVKQDFVDEKVHWTQPWLLIVLELWCREVL